MDKFPVLGNEPAKLDPVLDNTPVSYKEPRLKADPKGRRWSFSFRFWNQIEFFGLDKSDSSWFVSLLEKLKELSDKDVDKFIANQAEKSRWRYHHINWNQKNIPIKRPDLSWIDRAYLDNADDYPLLQFQISRALGRVVGFWDEKSVFNIVLLDPLHNIQPSKDFDYKVDPCDPLSCQYSVLLKKVDSLKSIQTCNSDCNYKNKVKDVIESSSCSVNVLMHFVSDGQLEGINSALDESTTYTDLLDFGADVWKKEKERVGRAEE